MARADAARGARLTLGLVFLILLRADLAVAKLTEKDIKRCGHIQECFCIKNTECGWCESSQQALWDKGGCHLFVTDPYSCPRLYCSANREAALVFWTGCWMLPAVHLTIWLAVCRWQRLLDARERRVVAASDNVSSAISFVTGQAKHNNLNRSFSNFTDVSDVVEEGKEFFYTLRTFEAFRQGVNCAPEDRLPCSASRPYNINVGDMSKEPGETNFEGARVPPHRLLITVRIALKWRTALGSNLPTVTGLMFISSLYMALLSFSAQVLPQRVYWAMALFTKETGALISSLQTMVSLLLSFYALERINWYWSMMRQGFAVQGRAHDIAMLCGTMSQDTDRNWYARYTLYRHIMLCFFFGYQHLTPNFKFVGFAPLKSCGLLTEEEAEIIEKAHSSPRTLLELWLARGIQDFIPDDAARQQALLAARELRGALAGISDLVLQRAPVSFESLLYVAVYALCLLLPLGPSQIDYENRSAVMTAAHVAIALGDGVLIAFYVSLLHLLYHLQAPFDNIGAPHDCLNPIAIMISTERKIRDYLAGPLSPMMDLGNGPLVKLNSRENLSVPSRRFFA